jgi:hypothetical protein
MANRYFRGQGTVKVATRTALGEPNTLRSLGNCPSLEISASEDIAEHYESETGDRRVDLIIRTSLKIEVNFTVENMNLDNLLMAYNGTTGTGAVGEEVMQAFGTVPVLFWLQFDGLNTLEGKSPFVVKFFKVQLQVPPAFALIGDELASMEFTGTVLYDSLNAAKGGYFTITQQALT